MFWDTLFFIINLAIINNICIFAEEETINQLLLK